MKKQENKNRRHFLLCMGGLLMMIVFAFAGPEGMLRLQDKSRLTRSVSISNTGTDYTVWKEEDETDISSLSVEELRKAKSNAKSKITKARNMLLYSSESKPKDGKENPLPDCPKRVKYEKKVAAQEALVEKIEYRLAELQ